MSEVKQSCILGIIINVCAIGVMAYHNFWHGIEVLQVGIGFIILAGVLHCANILERAHWPKDEDSGSNSFGE